MYNNCNGHCLILLKRITFNDDVSPGCVFRRFGLEECAAYWQQVVDMNDYQKIAFTSSRAATTSNGKNWCPKYSYGEPIIKESGTPPGPQKYVVLSVFFDYFMFLFTLLIMYERSKFLGDARFLVC